MSIQDYIDRYVQSKNTSINTDKDSILSEMLSDNEKRIYDFIKESDRQRLIKFS